MAEHLLIMQQEADVAVEEGGEAEGERWGWGRGGGGAALNSVTVST